MNISTSSEKSFFAARKGFLWGAVVFIFLLGLVIRLYDLTDLPFDFNNTRQMHSAVIARGIYYQMLPSAPQWQRDLAAEMKQFAGLIEPQILETITACTYFLAGGEKLWVARLYSILFWMLGGFFLFRLNRRVNRADGGVIALVYFLILPFGALASRSFQPDPMMTMFIILTWWSMLRWQDSPTWKNAVLAGLLGGLAILVKTTAVFFVGGAWVGLVLAGPGLKKAVRDRKIWVMGLLTVLPYLLYFVYGIFISGALTSQLEGRFFPNLWIDPVFYLQWNTMIASTAGFEWFWLALLCTFLIRGRAERGMFLGAWVGYFLYGMTFAYHISTHDYYQLPLLPLVAVGLAAGARLLFENLQGSKKVFSPVVLIVLLFIITVKAWDVRVTLKRDDYRSEAAFWQKLGQKLRQGSKVIGLTHDYGYRLYFWGWVRAEPWKTSADFNYQGLEGKTFDMEKLFKEETAGKDYFVVTLFDELEHQPELKKLLYDHYPYEEDPSGYIIFDLTSPRSALPSQESPHLASPVQPGSGQP